MVLRCLFVPLHFHTLWRNNNRNKTEDGWPAKPATEMWKKVCCDCVAGVRCQERILAVQNVSPRKAQNPGARAKARATARTSTQPRCRPLPLFPSSLLSLASCCQADLSLSDLQNENQLPNLPVSPFAAAERNEVMGRQI